MVACGGVVSASMPMVVAVTNRTLRLSPQPVSARQSADSAAAVIGRDGRGRRFHESMALFLDGEWVAEHQGMVLERRGHRAAVAEGEALAFGHVVVRHADGGEIDDVAGSWDGAAGGRNRDPAQHDGW